MSPMACRADAGPRMDPRGDHTDRARRAMHRGKGLGAVIVRPARRDEAMAIPPVEQPSPVRIAASGRPDRPDEPARSIGRLRPGSSGEGGGRGQECGQGDAESQDPSHRVPLRFVGVGACVGPAGARREDGSREGRRQVSRRPLTRVMEGLGHDHRRRRRRRRSEAEWRARGRSEGDTPSRRRGRDRPRSGSRRCRPGRSPGGPAAGPGWSPG